MEEDKGSNGREVFKYLKQRIKFSEFDKK